MRYNNGNCMRYDNGNCMRYIFFSFKTLWFIKNVTKFAFNCIFFYPGCFKSGLIWGKKTKTKQIIFKKKQIKQKSRKNKQAKNFEKNTKNKNKNEKERKQKYFLVILFLQNVFLNK